MSQKTNQESKSVYELFIFNLEIASALWVHIAAFEITLRNFLDFNLQKICMKRNWWNSPDFLRTRDKERIEKTIRRLIGRYKIFESEKLIENLSLSFWIEMCGRYYHELIWLPLQVAFPIHPGRRENFYKKARVIRDLRNSIAHHGPILRRNLLRDYEYLTELTRYLNPELALEVERNSSVLDLLQIAKSW